jgi:hypothetical protein
MTSGPHRHSELLVERLSHALAGTSGRITTVDSVRSLVALEIAEWNRETCHQTSSEHQTGALIAGPSELFC